MMENEEFTRGDINPRRMLFEILQEVDFDEHVVVVRLKPDDDVEVHSSTANRYFVSFLASRLFTMMHDGTFYNGDE